MLDDKYITDIDKPVDPTNQYLGQPDMICTGTGRLITSYPQGHGKGPLVMQISDDNGATWTKKTDIPKSWAGSQETPTLYVLNMADGGERIMLITACPGWGRDSAGNQYGFNTSYSDDNGNTWTEYKHWHSVLEDNAVNKAVYDPISGRLVITFREIQYDLNNNNQFDGEDDWICNDWGVWVGTYEDLMNQKPGAYRIRIKEDWTQNEKSGDTGYTGLVVLKDGTFIMDSYGHWDKEYSEKWGWGKVTTDPCYIKQAKFKLADVENDNNLVNYDDLEEVIAKAEEAAKRNDINDSRKAFEEVLTMAKVMIKNRNVQQIEVEAVAKEIYSFF